MIIQELYNNIKEIIKEIAILYPLVLMLISFFLGLYLLYPRKKDDEKSEDIKPKEIKL